VQERLPAQSNPSHEQSTLKLLMSGFNKKLSKEASKFGHCLKKRLWLISSKDSCLTSCTILRGGQLRNCDSRFRDKILSTHSSSDIFHLKTKFMSTIIILWFVILSTFRFRDKIPGKDFCPQ
jgi:hypothetical protein